MKPIVAVGLLAVGWYSATYLPFNAAVDWTSRNIIEHVADVRGGIAQAHAYTPTIPMHITPEEIEPEDADEPSPLPDTIEVQREKLTTAIIALKVGEGLRLNCQGKNEAACPTLYILAGEYYRLGGGE